jgi:exodeoxyribonuclease VII large subunit
MPRCIGIVTSSTGAAVQDILTVLKRRYSHANIIIYPTLVQGEQAAPAIVKAIQIANQRAECDILIVGRGGGSLEDLWPFNEEIVALAIYESEIPIISAVGHEVDFTIADFVADLRAPTPSAAAELATPDLNDLLISLQQSKQSFIRHMQAKIKHQLEQVKWMNKHLQQQHPKRRLAEKMQKLDYCELSLVQLQTRWIAQYQTKLHLLSVGLQQKHPKQHIQYLQHELAMLREQLNIKTQTAVTKKQVQLANLAGRLETLSPLATLQRGFAIASTTHHQVITHASNVKKGDAIEIRLMTGTLDCIVEKVRP